MKKNIWAVVVMKCCAFILFIICIFLVEGVLADNVIADDGIECVYGQNQFLKLVYEKMIVREEQITIRYVGEDYLEVFNLFEKELFLEKVASIDDPETSDDFDYLGNNLSKMKTSIKYSSSSEAIFFIQIEWRESYDETKAVNEKVSSIIDELELMDKSTYDKVKLVHDYIVENVEYDIDCVNENAYKALFMNSSTCQGYSLLFYKIMTEVGVGCRYITGTGISDESGPHGWNIVKIGDSWYSVDVTWDDPVYVNANNSNDEISYDYFLKGAGEFDSTHVRDSQFTIGSFMTNYNMSVSDFNEDDYSYTVGEDVEESKALMWSFTQREIDCANGLYRKVIITDLSTYGNILPNIVQGFSNIFSKNGLLSTIAIMWSELSGLSKFIFIMFFIIVLLNITYKVMYRRSEKEMPVM